MTPKGHAIPSKTQLLSYGTPAFGAGFFVQGFVLFRALIRQNRNAIYHK